MKPTEQRINMNTKIKCSFNGNPKELLIENDQILPAKVGPIILIIETHIPIISYKYNY